MKGWTNDYGDVPRWWWLVHPWPPRQRSRVLPLLLALTAGIS